MNQLTMFKMVLKLENEDDATSDDPLEIHLQRRGWNLARVKELQASISKKLTLDLFDNTTEELSQSECTLQEHIEEFFRATTKVA